MQETQAQFEKTTKAYVGKWISAYRAFSLLWGEDDIVPQFYKKLAGLQPKDAEELYFEIKESIMDELDKEMFCENPKDETVRRLGEMSKLLRNQSLVDLEICKKIKQRRDS